MSSTIGFGLVLTAIWVLLWGELSWTNLLSGVVVVTLLLVSLPDVRHRAHVPVVRPAALVRLGIYLLGQLLTSNVVLAREVLTRRPRIATGVVAVPLPGSSDELLTLVANFIAMTPGTMPVEVERDPAVIYVHVLHLRDVEDVRRQTWRLRDLTVRAFGSHAAIGALP